MQFITPLPLLLEQGVNELQGAVNDDLPELKLYTKIDAFLFAKVLNDGRFRNVDEAVRQLATHSRNVWAAGVRMALSGQPYAVAPVARTALEAACYAMLINHDVSLVRIWLDRHNDADSMEKSRRQFGNAIKKVCKLLETKATGLGDMLSEAYQACIDEGAHPNTKGIPRARKILVGPNNFRAEYDETNDFYGIPSMKSRDAMCVVAYVGLLICHVLGLTIMRLDELPRDLLNEMLDDFDAITAYLST